jgi:glycosyltransferase involved in cell wall biosynthesis
MRIGIDARILGHPRSGIAVYVVNLVEEFLKRPGLEIVLFSDRPVYKEYLATINKVKTVVFGQRHRKRWSQIYLPAELKRHGVDIYHATWNNALPVFTSVPGVLTVHDLIPLVVSGYFKKLNRRLRYILSMRSAVKKAKVIITDAESTKDDLVRYFRVPKDKIRPIHLGIAPPQPNNDPARKKAVLDRFGIETDYIVNIGSYDTRRNAEGLIRVFGRFLSASGADAQLVLIGGYDNFKQQINQFKTLISELGLEGRVIFTNYVTEDEKNILFSGARLMLHLSLYEGFCIPILEAMCLGVPVIASDRGSIPEIGGDAAIFVDPLDEAGAAGATEGLWRDTAARGDLAKKGSRRIKAFSWEDAANKTLDCYREALAQDEKIP